MGGEDNGEKIRAKWERDGNSPNKLKHGALTLAFAAIAGIMQRPSRREEATPPDDKGVSPHHVISGHRVMSGPQDAHWFSTGTRQPTYGLMDTPPLKT